MKIIQKSKKNKGDVGQRKRKKKKFSFVVRKRKSNDQEKKLIEKKKAIWMKNFVTMKKKCGILSKNNHVELLYFNFEYQIPLIS